MKIILLTRFKFRALLRLLRSWRALFFSRSCLVAIALSVLSVAGCLALYVAHDLGKNLPVTVLIGVFAAFLPIVLSKYSVPQLALVPIVLCVSLIARDIVLMTVDSLAHVRNPVLPDSWQYRDRISLNEIWMYLTYLLIISIYYFMLQIQFLVNFIIYFCSSIFYSVCKNIIPTGIWSGYYVYGGSGGRVISFHLEFSIFLFISFLFFIFLLRHREIVDRSSRCALIFWINFGLSVSTAYLFVKQYSFIHGIIFALTGVDDKIGVFLVYYVATTVLGFLFSSRQFLFFPLCFCTYLIHASSASDATAILMAFVFLVSALFFRELRRTLWRSRWRSLPATA